MKPDIKKYIQFAEKYCEKINKNHVHSIEYVETMLYIKYGSKIGIKECKKIAQKITKNLKK